MVGPTRAKGAEGRPRRAPSAPQAATAGAFGAGEASNKITAWGQLPAPGKSPGPEARRVRLRCRLVAQSGRPSVLCTLVRASGSAPLGSCLVVRCASLWLVVTRWYREAGAQRSICRRALERPSRYAAVWPSTANSMAESSALLASCAEATTARAASIILLGSPSASLEPSARGEYLVNIDT